MKKVLLAALGVCLGVSVAGGQVEAGYYPSKPAYDYEVVNQSSNAELAPGESAILWVQLKNTGYETWYSDRFNDNKCGGQTKCGVYENPIHLGTTRGQDRSSLFFTNGNWITTNRVHQADEDMVAPGEVMHFGYMATAPTSLAGGNYREYFAPVIEGKTWMADKGLYWDILIKGEPKETYQAEVVTPNYFEYDLQAGETQEVKFAFRNTGNATWYNGGQGAIHLATVNPKDNYSDLYFDSWMAPNRPAYMEEQVVRPGEIGHFAMVAQTPDEPIHGVGGNRYYDEYWLVAEGVTWFDYYWGYTEPARLAINVPVDDDYEPMFDPDNSFINLYPESGVSANGADEAVLEIVLRDQRNNPIANTKVRFHEQSCLSLIIEGDECAWDQYEYGVTDSEGVFQKYITKDEQQLVKYRYYYDGMVGGESNQIFFY